MLTPSAISVTVSVFRKELSKNNILCPSCKLLPDQSEEGSDKQDLVYTPSLALEGRMNILKTLRVGEIAHLSSANISGNLSVVGNVKIAKINNVPVYKDVSGKEIIYKLSSKEEMVILGEDGEYYNIQGAQGEGWVKKILVK